MDPRAGGIGGEGTVPANRPVADAEARRDQADDPGPEERHELGDRGVLVDRVPPSCQRVQDMVAVGVAEIDLAGVESVGQRPAFAGLGEGVLKLRTVAQQADEVAPERLGRDGGGRVPNLAFGPVQ